MVIVSHDREFLDQLCTKIVETEFGVATTYKVCALASCLHACISFTPFPGLSGAASVWQLRCKLRLIAAWHIWTVSLCAAGQLHRIHSCQRGKYCCSMGCLGKTAKGSCTPGAEEQLCSLAKLLTGLMPTLHLICAAIPQA